MPSQEPITRKGITSLADIPNDVVTFWIRRGVVKPIEGPAGTGRHLRFAWHEVNIAAVMGQLRLLGAPIDSLVSLAATYRAAIEWGLGYGLSRGEVLALRTVFHAQDMYERGALDADKLASYLAVDAKETVRPDRITERVLDLSGQVNRTDFEQHWETFASIYEQPTPGRYYASPHESGTFFWPSKDGWKVSHDRLAESAAAHDGALALIKMNVPSVLFLVWNRS